MPDDYSDYSIVIAEDDDDDFFLLSEVLSQIGIDANIIRAADGEELITTMATIIDPSAGGPDDRKVIVLLDLNMPRKSGMETLRELRSFEVLKSIPIVILSTSTSEQSVHQTYALGANAYLCKPQNMQEFKEVMLNFKKFWFDNARIPRVKKILN